MTHHYKDLYIRQDLQLTVDQDQRKVDYLRLELEEAERKLDKSRRELANWNESNRR